MCGLVGIAGDLAFKDEDTMRHLLLVDYFRGKDSTGLAAVRKHDNVVKLAKDKTDPISIFHDSRFKEALSGHNSKAFIGHNRAATRGEVTKYNAHPYEVGKIVGAHNGTLDYQSQSRLETAVGEKFGTDSMVLFAAIDALGVKDAIELCTEGKDSATGAWSLVWYNKEEDSLNFLRNKHRPMYYSYSKDFKRLFWASEWRMIRAATEQAAVELYVNDEGFAYFPTEENLHMKFDLKTLMAGGDKIYKPTAVVIKGREPVTVVSSYVTDPFNRGTTYGATARTSTTTSPGTSTKKDEKDNVTHIHLVGDRNNPLAHLLDKEQFEQYSKFGCSFCSEPIDFGDHGITLYQRDGTLLCADCSGHDFISDDAPPSRIYVKPEVLEKLL